MENCFDQLSERQQLNSLKSLNSERINPSLNDRSVSGVKLTSPYHSSRTVSSMGSYRGRTTTDHYANRICSGEGNSRNLSNPDIGVSKFPAAPLDH